MQSPRKRACLAPNPPRQGVHSMNRRQRRKSPRRPSRRPPPSISQPVSSTNDDNSRITASRRIITDQTCNQAIGSGYFAMHEFP